MKDIYITGTFRDEWSRAFNVRFEKALSDGGFSCYLPQRDSEQEGNKPKTFSDDIQGIDEAKMIVAISSKSQTANWGYEIGYARKAGKPVVILASKELGVELFPEQAAATILYPDDFDDIEGYIDDVVIAVKNLLN